MRTEDFNYDLPESFIANDPVVPRDSSKLMLVDTSLTKVFHHQFSDIKNYLRPGDVLVLNRSRVIPARIVFDLDGNEREIFLLRKISSDVYQVLVRPGRVFKIGFTFVLGDNVNCSVEKVLEDGTRHIKFLSDNLEADLEDLGEVPLPPYIKGSKASFDQYQTVYAQEKGSVAAPTAGLHFTKSLLDDFTSKGVQVEEVLLHVGRGTFLPVSSEDISDHLMHSEFYTMSSEVADRLNAAVSEGRRIIAVGTTSVRVLESVYDSNEGFVAGSGETDIFIYPGNYKWKVVNGLVTNFHLPKSSLIMLVASFLESKGVENSVERILEMYELAKSEDYRFYSFGDAMFIF